MREQFEKLPEIANVFNGLHPTIIWFCDIENKYATSFVGFDDRVKWLNGAWYAFQEQQKKIDGLNLKIQDLISKYESKTTLPVLDQWSDCFVKSARGMVNDLKELLND